MSFYGTVFYEFEQLFFKFKFKNVADNVDDVDLDMLDSQDGITATRRWDTFHIHSGNRWIKLASMEEGGETKGLTLFHAAPGPKKYDLETISVAAEGAKPSVIMKPEETLSIPTINYDNAGHIVSVDKQAYQLPNADEIVDLGMTTHFDPAISKQGIEHDIEVPEDESGVIVLQPGQVVATTKLDISQKGVITGAKDVLYKMPMSDTEADMEDLQTRMEDAEENIVDINERLALDYAPIVLTGTIDDLYAENSVVPDVNRFSSLADAIGNLEMSNRTINPEQITESVSVADQLLAVHELASSVNVQSANLISQLTTRLEALEKKVATLT